MTTFLVAAVKSYLLIRSICLTMSTLTAAQRKKNKAAKEAPAIVIFLIFVSEIGFNWLYVHFLEAAFLIPSTLTNGLIHPIFVLSLLKIGFIILGVTFWIGKFTKHHMGLTAMRFRMGVISTFFFWSFMQLIMVFIGSFSAEGVTLLAGESDHTPLHLVGVFLLFAFSKAFYDETVYRAFVLPQFHLKVKRFIDLPPMHTLLIAVVASQLVYVIIQMPLISTIIDEGTSLTLTFISLFLLSILNAVVYLRTHNVFICIGLHALWYYPLFVVRAPIEQQYLLVAIALGLVLIWPMLPKNAHMRKSWPTQKQRFG